jgi:hypothetical protein
MEVSGKLHAPGRFIPQENSPWYQLDWRLEAVWTL